MKKLSNQEIIDLLTPGTELTREQVIQIEQSLTKGLVDNTKNPGADGIFEAMGVDVEKYNREISPLIDKCMEEAESMSQYIGKIVEALTKEELSIYLTLQMVELIKAKTQNNPLAGLLALMSRG